MRVRCHIGCIALNFTLNIMLLLLNEPKGKRQMNLWIFLLLTQLVLCSALFLCKNVFCAHLSSSKYIYIYIYIYMYRPTNIVHHKFFFSVSSNLFWYALLARCLFFFTMYYFLLHKMQTFTWLNYTTAKFFRGTQVSWLFLKCL